MFICGAVAVSRVCVFMIFNLSLFLPLVLHTSLAEMDDMQWPFAWDNQVLLSTIHFHVWVLISGRSAAVSSCIALPAKYIVTSSFLKFKVVGRKVAVSFLLQIKKRIFDWILSIPCWTSGIWFVWLSSSTLHFCSVVIRCCSSLLFKLQNKIFATT